MRHDWIFDVLSDLRAYAVAHGMTALATKADEALQVARDEVARVGNPDGPSDLPSPGTKSH